MRIFLIRHGETVDNVANIYAGVRDSALTVHGTLQAQRLGKFLTESNWRFTHVFSSDLERAHQTANAICLAQSDRYGDEEEAPVKAVLLPVLREQDFGSLEGQPFSTRYHDTRKPVNGEKEEQAQSQDQDHVDIESKESMGRRANAFLTEHLVHVMNQTTPDHTPIVAVVSHGILLSHLWRGLLRLLPQNSVTLSTTLAAEAEKEISLEYIGGWSNTGYLELSLQRKDPAVIGKQQSDDTGPAANSSAPGSSKVPIQPENWEGIRTSIITINGKSHLLGLKRTRGGVGSSRQEEGQTTIDTFFKKRKV